MFDFSNYSAKSKYYYDSKRIIVIKTKDETGGIAIKKFVDWKQKIYVLVDGCSEHEKSMNKPVKSPSEYRDVLLNNKCLTHSMNRM